MMISKWMVFESWSRSTVTRDSRGLYCWILRLVPRPLPGSPPARTKKYPGPSSDRHIVSGGSDRPGAIVTPIRVGSDSGVSMMIVSAPSRTRVRLGAVNLNLPLTALGPGPAGRGSAAALSALRPARRARRLTQSVAPSHAGDGHSNGTVGARRRSVMGHRDGDAGPGTGMACGIMMHRDTQPAGLTGGSCQLSASARAVGAQPP